MTKLKIIIIFLIGCLFSVNLYAGRITDEIQDHLLSTFNFDPEMTEIACRTELDTLQISDSTNIAISCREYPAPRGYFPLKVVLQDGRGEVRAISTSVQISFYEYVLVSNTRVKSRHDLSRYDFTLQRIEVGKLIGDPIKDFAQIDGMRASKTISKGKVLTDQMTEPIPIIKKGERVRIVYESGNLKIESYGIARKDAIKGEMVEVKNTNSGKNIYGRATAQGFVMVER
jgi:flagella basal body P-ring formation protein FlgA